MARFMRALSFALIRCARPSMRPSIHAPVRQSARPSMRPPVHAPARPCARPSMRPPVHAPARPCARLYDARVSTLF